MNTKELIERIKNLPFSYIHNEPYLNKEVVLEFAKHLDEPETGHADEAPRYVKNILTRLRELPLHDREVWLKVIISEFKQDFSHAKWREGYEQGKVEGMVERDKVTIPQLIADWIEECKAKGKSLLGALLYTPEGVNSWVGNSENQELFARAWLDGYEVEKEKRYLVKIIGITDYNSYLNYRKAERAWTIESKMEVDSIRTNHTYEELEQAGFSWVFDCEGIEIEEVTE